jgi:serine/threonine protein kinase
MAPQPVFIRNSQDDDTSAEALARNALIDALREDHVIDPGDISLMRLLGAGRTAEVYLGELIDLQGECMEVAVKQFQGICLSSLEQEWREARGEGNKVAHCDQFGGDCGGFGMVDASPQKGLEHGGERCSVSIDFDDGGLGGEDEMVSELSLSPSAQHRLERRKNRKTSGDKRLNARRYSSTSEGSTAAPPEERNSWGSDLRRRSGGSTDDQSEGIVQFAREFCILEGLEHDHILRLHGILLGDALRGQPMALVTEFCAGGSLCDLLHNSDVTLSWAQRRDALMHAARGVEYLHSRDPPVIHRDLKPQNLLLKHEVLGPEDEIYLKVADFGLCRTLGVETNAGKMTVDVGTVCYMAPEVMCAPGGTYNLQADVYSFGVVIFEMLARQPPFACARDPGILCKNVAAGLRPDDDAGFLPEEETTGFASDGACPQDLPLLMRRCWSGDPSSRPTSAQVRQCLECPDI